MLGSPLPTLDQNSINQESTSDRGQQLIARQIPDASGAAQVSSHSPLLPTPSCHAGPHQGTFSAIHCLPGSNKLQRSSNILCTSSTIPHEALQNPHPPSIASCHRRQLSSRTASIPLVTTELDPQPVEGSIVRCACPALWAAYRRPCHLELP